MAKVLMVATQEIITDLSDGGKRVSNRNYHLLCDVYGEENVFLVMCTNMGELQEKQIKRVAAYNSFIDRAINILSGRISMSRGGERYILELVKKEKIDIVFLDRTIQGSLANKIKKYNDAIKIWSFSHNIEFNYFRNKLKRNVFLSKVIGWIIGRSERLQIKKTDQLFVLTDRDNKLNKMRYGKDSIIIPTSFVDKFDYKRVQFNFKDKKRQLLFIGTMFGPNYEGIKWFVDNVMPELGECHLTIVGKNFEKKKNELQRENVEVIGGVEDLEKYYYMGNMMVMPIFYGDGQKVKTAEAMMYGKVILATDEALEGYEVSCVNGIFRCNSKEDFIETIRKIKDEDMHNYSVSVRNAFCKNNSYSEIVEKIAPIMKGLVS